MAVSVLFAVIPILLQKIKTKKIPEANVFFA